VLGNQLNKAAKLGADRITAILEANDRKVFKEIFEITELLQNVTLSGV